MCNDLLIHVRTRMVIPWVPRKYLFQCYQKQVLDGEAKGPT